MPRRPQRFRIDREQLRITRGALILLLLEVGLSLVWTFVDEPARADMAEWLVPTSDSGLAPGQGLDPGHRAAARGRFLSLISRAS